MDTASERLESELALIGAMYPEAFHFDAKSSEVRITRSDKASLVLRVPDTYPVSGLPEIVTATDSAKTDIRRHVQDEMLRLHLLQGEEVLDSVLQAFEDLLTRRSSADHESIHDQGSINEAMTSNQGASGMNKNTSKVVIIWLHHLLATSKRKLALHPSIQSAANGSISGITKPGYPGILVFSGPAELVAAHVSELKNQRWQAFQVRFEEDYVATSGEVKRSNWGWLFEHGAGIKELESMSDVVQDISSECNREIFLKAVGVK